MELSNIIDKVQKKAEDLDIKGKAAQAGDALLDKAADVKESAMSIRDDIDDKIHELDNMLNEAVTQYNDVYTAMNDKGVRLFVERTRAADTLAFIEMLINSIANTPKEFDADFELIHEDRKTFIESCQFAEKELQAARNAAGGAGAGLVAGASVAFMAPTAAMWIATTFGTASTGVAITSLSGAAATNAALAWLGGGALATGGGGMAGGTAFLALAGPVGWSIAGATLLTSIVLFTKKRAKLNKQKNEEIEAVKNNIEIIKETDNQIAFILDTTTSLRNELNNKYKETLSLYKQDYASFDVEQKTALASLVNNAKALAAMFKKTI